MAFSGSEYNNTYLQILPYELQEEIEHEVQRYKFNDVLAVMMKEIKNDNFVFLNVDNPKWQSYIEKFNVNGIPQVNIIDKKGNLISLLSNKFAII